MKNNVECKELLRACHNTRLLPLYDVMRYANVKRCSWSGSPRRGDVITYLKRIMLHRESTMRRNVIITNKAEIRTPCTDHNYLTSAKHAIKGISGKDQSVITMPSYESLTRQSRPS